MKERRTKVASERRGRQGDTKGVRIRDGGVGHRARDMEKRERERRPFEPPSLILISL
jgi:hypothetical protein